MTISNKFCDESIHETRLVKTFIVPPRTSHCSKALGLSTVTLSGFLSASSLMTTPCTAQPATAVGGGASPKVAQPFYPNLVRQDDSKSPKNTISSSDSDSTASLGVWGYFNKVFQARVAQDKTEPKGEEKKGMPSSASEPSSPPPPELRPAPASSNPIEPNAPSKVKKVVEQRETIIPHKATYTITLDKSYDDISDAAGEMTINVVDTGDGYVFEQNSTLIIYNVDGEGEQIMTNLATWQDYGGDRYRFTSRTVRNGEEEDVIKGEAIKNHSTRTAEVTYQLPLITTILIPYETLFPLHHLAKSLEAAQKGLHSLSNPIFDGSNETYEAVMVDTLLGAPKPSNLKVKIDGNMNFQTKWPMRISVYPLDSACAEPEYEMTQNVLGPGIIKDMTLDYGLFAVKAELNHITFYDGGEQKDSGNATTGSPTSGKDSMDEPSKPKA